jgi:hypothetical protein
MPVKRRKDKRRANLPPEAWDMVFTSGHDYFGDLDPLGLVEPHRAPPESQARPDAEAAWDDALREAWAVHGRAFMAQWEPQPGKPLPWAAETFGLPVNAESFPVSGKGGRMPNTRPRSYQSPE